MQGPSGCCRLRRCCPFTIRNVIEDALFVLKELGFRYLWVDRYCIDQGDDRDKAIQIANMNQVFANAQVTIIAAARDWS